MIQPSRARLLGGLLSVVVLSVLGAILASLVHDATAERRKANHRSRTRAEVEAVMPLSHDNDMLLDTTRVSAPFYLGARRAVTVYRARKRMQPVGAVIPVFAADGFNGSMDLLVGIAYDGSVTGVRVTEHNETAGFGDAIHQKRSDWLAAFVGRSLDNPGAAGWDLKSANGSFDDISGATISAAAVVKAVSRSLHFYRENRRRLYQPPRPVE